MLIIASTWADGELTTDNLIVSNDAAIYGKMNFYSTIVTTNTNSIVATGGAITTNVNYRIHTFTNVGTANFTVSGGSLSCEVLIVAGGGGGGAPYHAGGGGGGGVISNTLTLSGENTVVVGQGGAGAIDNTDNGGFGYNGTDSSIGTNVAYGGGGGARWYAAAGHNGGSGGGGAPEDNNSGGVGTPGQGHNGGAGAYRNAGGGGGGGGTVGQTAPSDSNGGAGGEGYASSISGSSYKYGAGGGGGGYSASGSGGAGGVNGGGGGGVTSSGTNAAPNSGSGGGGSGQGYSGGNGGSGIVIVRYPFAPTSNITSITISSNGINQANSSGANVFMSKVGIGTNNPAEKLHIAGNVQIDGGIKLGGETRSNWPNVAEGALIASNNLSDVADPAAARDNLGIGSWTTNEAGAFLSASGDGSQLTNITAAQVGALSTNAGALLSANNLSDVANAGAARNNLGLGSAATNNANAFLSTTGGVVNGANYFIIPAEGMSMGSFTNQ